MGDFYSRRHFDDGFQGERFQLDSVHVSSNTWRPPHTPLGLQSYGGQSPSHRARFPLHREGGQGQDYGSRGRGIGVLRAPADDGHTSELMSRNLGISTQGINPFLCPVVFVKSRNVLFTDHDEIFMPEVVDGGTLESFAAPPSANQVEALFHPASTSPPPAAISNDNESEGHSQTEPKEIQDFEVSPKDSIELPLFSDEPVDRDNESKEAKENRGDSEYYSDENEDPWGPALTELAMPDVTVVGTIKASTNSATLLGPDIFPVTSITPAISKGEPVSVATSHLQAPLIGHSPDVPLKDGPSSVPKGKLFAAPPSADQVEALFHPASIPPPPAAISNDNESEGHSQTEPKEVQDREGSLTDSMELPLFSDEPVDRDPESEEDEENREDNEYYYDENEDPWGPAPTELAMPNVAEVATIKPSINPAPLLGSAMSSTKSLTAVISKSKPVAVATPRSQAPLPAHSPDVPRQDGPSSAPKGKSEKPVPTLSKKQLKKVEKQLKRAESRKQTIDPIEQQLRSFILNSSETSLTLPPVNKKAHYDFLRIATSFKLDTSISTTGKMKRLTITITKTEFTEIVEEDNSTSELGEREIAKDGEVKRSSRKKHHREGEEVGKHAAKIDDSNVGYQLLQTMGWTEGDRIGVAGGLEAPLTAVFKISKLGLGAQ